MWCGNQEGGDDHKKYSEKDDNSDLHRKVEKEK
jgi:hypothetical protein